MRAIVIDICLSVMRNPDGKRSAEDTIERINADRSLSSRAGDWRRAAEDGRGPMPAVMRLAAHFGAAPAAPLAFDPASTRVATASRRTVARCRRRLLRCRGLRGERAVALAGSGRSDPRSSCAFRCCVHECEPRRHRQRLPQPAPQPAARHAVHDHARRRPLDDIRLRRQAQRGDRVHSQSGRGEFVQDGVEMVGIATRNDGRVLLRRFGARSPPPPPSRVAPPAPHGAAPSRPASS
jgi:hypothetical protein